MLATSTGTTGRLFEWSVLGAGLATPSCEYMPFRGAMNLARRLAAWDPIDPEPRQASDLHAYVCESLDVGVDEVRFYSALGTVLDTFHGVDGWFEWRGRVVTIDLTANEHKDRCRADVMIRPEHLDDDGGKEIAILIASFFRL